MKNAFNQKAKIGLLTVFSAILLLAILILASSLASLLPKNATLLDASENKMYSLSAEAKKEIATVNDEIDIYLLVTGGEDALSDMGIHLNTFLKRAAALNGNINYKLIDLYTNDNFLENRGIDSSTVTLNSIVVESKLRNRYIDSGELFYYYIDGVGKVTQNEAQLYQMYYGLQSTYKFDGEALLLNSLSYVTSTDLPLAISLTGHGETALSSQLKTQFTTSGIDFAELDTLSLVPGCEMLIINNPTADITANEALLISQYLGKGGKLFLITAPGTSGFSNLAGILEKFGLGYEDGIIMDSTQGNYYQYPYYLVPSYVSHDAVSGISTSALLPFSHGISVSEASGVYTSKLFNTSPDSYIVATNATTTQKPEGQEEKSYTVGVISENEVNDSAVIWISSQLFLDESVNSAVGGGNFEYASSLSAYICGAATEESVTAEPLTLTTEKLTFTPISMAAVALLVVGIVPISIIIIGIVYCYRRKRK